MESPSSGRQRLSFGPFEADLSSGKLYKLGHQIHVQEQPFRVLAMLLEHPGEMVTREAVRKALWPEGTYVDFDEGLDTALKKLRHALGDSAQNPNFIETIPRRGYRFIVPVTGTGVAPAETEGLSGAIPPNAKPATLPLIDDTGSQGSTKAPTAPKATLFKYALGVMTILITLTAFRLYRRAPFGGDFSPQNLKVIRLTENGKVSGVALSPGGHFAVYAKREGEKEGLWIRQVATRSDVQIVPPDTNGFHGLTFSPDGNYIYFVRSDKKDAYFKYLYSIPTLGGTIRKLITDVDSPVSFSPDGRQFVYEHCGQPTNDIEIKVAYSDGSGDHVLAVVHNGSGFMFQPGPNWSPDGKTIVVPALLLEKPQRWVLYSVSTTTGRLQELYSSSNENELGRPVWIAGGRELLMPHYDPVLHRSQLWTFSLSRGEAHYLTRDLTDYGSDLDLTHDGQTAAAIATKTVSHVWSAPATNLSAAEQVTAGDFPLLEVEETSDGKLLAIGDDGALWIMNTDGSQLARFSDARNASAVTPCGQFILFISEELGTISLVRVDRSGMQPTTIATSNLCCPVCSRDGRSAFYVSIAQPQKIWQVPITGGTPSEVAEALGTQLVGNLTISPDGRFLAYPYTQYGHVPSEGRSAAVIPIDGGPTVRNFKLLQDSGNVYLRWSPDGKGLQYILMKNGASNIWEQVLAGGDPKQLTKFTSGEIFDFNWTSDGKHLLLTRGETTSDVVLIRSHPPD
jgi:DNA-binding winged helix-turn-helix (wHTH) protein/Tol biopolymer transport system component